MPYTAAAIVLLAGLLYAAPDLPELTGPVNDFAHVIDDSSAAEIDRMSRALQQQTGDAVVVATVPTIEPYGDINEYAVKLFENHGKGIGEKGKDNGVLIVVALKERKVKVEPGYGLEEFITDGYSGEISRDVMAPEFRQGRYGPGLRAGVERIVGRIAQARGITLDGVRVPTTSGSRGGKPTSFGVILLIFFAILIISRIGGGPGGRRRRYWGGGPWSGWSSGVGPFGGGWSGGGFGGGGSGGGGGFGGGFGGFGGGRSGGGGGGASW